MNKKETYTKFVVVFFSIVMIMSAIGISVLEDIATEKSAPLSEEKVEDTPFEDNTKTPQKHGTRASSPRTVLAELFTHWGCSHCPKAGASMNELMDVYDSSQLVMIAYHISSSSDPFYLYNPADNNARKNYYGYSSTPLLFVDGPPIIYASSQGKAATYLRYKNHIDIELAELSNMTITLEGYLDQVLMNGTINATIEVTDALPDGNLTVRFAVVEDNVYAPGPNGEKRHRYNMRDMLEDEPLPPLTVGQSYEVARTFPMDPTLNWDSISVVVFVQNDDQDSKDVLQAATYDFIPQDILVVDDDETENPVGTEDYYQEILCQMGLAFDGWTLNERGSPSSLDLANYEAVIWLTGNTWSSTLTNTDQTAISEYLDSGRGSLFLSGENIGVEIGASTFYQDYLHSNFITNDIGDGNISGINDDPISDPFFGMTIPITGSSPSEISPISPATTIFQYSPSGVTGGIKAEHDSNSKVVYFAFRYFEGSDSDSNKMTLMERILEWIMNFTSTIPLSEGWNLISIPLIQPDTSLGTVLESIEGEYDSLQWYDSSDLVDSWKHHHILKPSEMNDLSDLNHEIAFWVHITTPGGTLLKCNGTQPAENQIIGLHIGWNLVGYPSLIDRKRDLALNNINFGTDVDSVWTYDIASQQWKELGLSDNFELGRGYWIHSTVEKMWDVPL